MAVSDVKLKHPDRLFIGGQWVAPSTDRRFGIIHPGTGELALSMPEAREEDMERAVAAARRAFDQGPWPRMSQGERNAVLLRWADAIEARADDLANAYSTEIGIPISTTRYTAAALPGILRGAVETARAYRFVDERPATGGKALVTREPVGVVAAIVPWNFPASLGLVKIAPALAVGCTVVVKPSPEAPLDLILMAECLEDAGLPEGVLSIVQADRDVGDRLVRDPRIDKVSFTGSTAAGRHIGAVCMERVARVSLELGGKSAAIVLDDMDMAQVVPGLTRMSTLLGGQACMALTRVLVSEKRAEELEAGLAAAYAAIKVGDPFDPATQMGPLATERQRDRVEAYIATGKAQGARLATGGGRPAYGQGGFFVEPTVFTHVTSDMTIAREEIFGPVISVLRYRDEEEAVAMANDSAYGLNGAIFTADQDKFHALARRIRSGTVAQNAIGPQAGLPFGGYKQSGIGREGSPEAFDLYTEVKTLYLAA
ncbi:aldehyde dehydrogenase (NAD+) [Sphingobium faniae]|nr:aldehyde dehydrogenase (NAD+) [Sphingobium faniae]